MDEIKTYLKDNKTLKTMLLNDKNEYNKTGALEQIRLDTGQSISFIYENYHNILQIVKQ